MLAPINLKIKTREEAEMDAINLLKRKHLNQDIGVHLFIKKIVMVYG